MKLAVFLSDWRRTEETLERLKADKLGIILVENGIYHAVVKEGGKDSPVLSKAGATFYALTDDLETRGYTAANVNPKVKLVNYGDIVDLIMKDYEKTAWL
jgi:sulfur relay protein TusB/DsrH